MEDVEGSKGNLDELSRVDRHLIDLGGIELLYIPKDTDVVHGHKLLNQTSVQRGLTRIDGRKGLAFIATPLRPKRPDRPIRWI